MHAAASLDPHLDDIRECNSIPFDARSLLWSFGNDTVFNVAEPTGTITRIAKRTRKWVRSGEIKKKRIVLRHGDCLLINVERIIHGVTVLEGQKEGCADSLPGRRACVAVRPCLTKSSPNVEDYSRTS